MTRPDAIAALLNIQRHLQRWTDWDTWSGGPAHCLKTAIKALQDKQARADFVGPPRQADWHLYY